MILKQKAIDIATKDAGGFLGTWVDAVLKGNEWHIDASSKSAKPPMYYIIDAITGKILLKIDNKDDPNQKKKLLEYLNKS